MRDIDTIPIRQLMRYLYSLSRLYAIFSLVNIFTLYIAIKNNGVTAALNQLIGFILYVINTSVILWVTLSSKDQNRPELYKITLICTTITILLLFNFYNTIYTGYVTRSPTVLFSIVSLFLQASTLYIVIKLRGKVVEQELSHTSDSFDMNSSVGVASAIPISRGNETYIPPRAIPMASREEV